MYCKNALSSEAVVKKKAQNAGILMCGPYGRQLRQFHILTPTGQNCASLPFKHCDHGMSNMANYTLTLVLCDYVRYSIVILLV